MFQKIKMFFMRPFARSNKKQKPEPVAPTYGSPHYDQLLRDTYLYKSSDVIKAREEYAQREEQRLSRDIDILATGLELASISSDLFGSSSGDDSFSSSSSSSDDSWSGGGGDFSGGGSSSEW